MVRPIPWLHSLWDQNRKKLEYQQSSKYIEWNHAEVKLQRYDLIEMVSAEIPPRTSHSTAKDSFEGRQQTPQFPFCSILIHPNG